MYNLKVVRVTFELTLRLNKHAVNTWGVLIIRVERKRFVWHLLKVQRIYTTGLLPL